MEGEAVGPVDSIASTASTLLIEDGLGDAVGLVVEVGDQRTKVFDLGRRRLVEQSNGTDTCVWGDGEVSLHELTHRRGDKRVRPAQQDLLRIHGPVSQAVDARSRYPSIGGGHGVRAVRGYWSIVAHT